jgi:hypothetical protein
MNGLRRAALALHGLPEHDRHWVLERLAGADRTRLTQLLDELQKLGIPPDELLLADAQKRIPEAPAPSRIQQASAAQMLAILAREPAGLITAVLRIEPWPWQAAFLARLEPALRERVAAAMRRDSRTSDKLSSALRSCLEARLAAVPASHGRPQRFRALAAQMRAHAHRARGVFSSAFARWAR